jgi:MFS family permease
MKRDFWPDLGALSVTAYRRYAFATFASLVGTRMQRIVVSWIVWDATRSGFWLGLVAFAELFPILLLSRLAGCLIDRFGALRVLLYGQIAAALQTAIVICICTQSNVSAPLLAVAALFLGIASAFCAPADLAMLSTLIDRSRYPSAVSINSFLSNIGVFAGPALAGIVLATLGAGPAIALNGLSFLVLVAVLVRLRTHRLHDAPLEPIASGPIHSSPARPGDEGATATIVGSMILVCGAMSVSGRSLIQILPSYSNGVLGQGATFLTWCTGLTGIGAALGGLWMGRSPEKSSIVRGVLISSLVCALALFVLAIQQNALLALPLFLIFGACLGINGVGTQLYVQLSCDPRVRGKTLGTYSMTFRGGTAAGALCMGFIVSWADTSTALLVSTCVCLALWVFIKSKQKSLEASMPVAAIT